MKTFVYVDAFNLYYGAVKDTGYKWIDIDALCRNVCPKNYPVSAIKYCTARIKPRSDDPGKPTRQQMYLRALLTIPHLNIIYGHFLEHNTWMPRVTTPPGEKPFVEVIKTEEKGSDVNMASHLLIDAFDGAFDCAILITGDSDLCTPVKMVKNKFGKIVGVINPQKRQCKALREHATFYKHIREPAVQASQFPTNMTDAKGNFHKPSEW